MQAAPRMQAALVSGGSRGIGLASAVKLVQEGFHVGIIGRNKEGLQRALERLRVDSKPGFIARAYACDVANAEAVNATAHAFAKDMMDEGVAPSVLVNAAGVNIDGLLMRMKDADVQRVIGTNTLGTLYLCRALSKTFLRNKTPASIINIGSIVGSCGQAGQSVYSTSKAALLGLTSSLSKEMGPRGVRVNLVEPGFIITDMTKGLKEDGMNRILAQQSIQRLGTPEDVAEMVAFLADEKKASYVTGQTFRVDGGIGVRWA